MTSSKPYSPARATPFSTANSGPVGEANRSETDCRDIVSVRFFQLLRNHTDKSVQKLKISQMHTFLQKLNIAAASNSKKKGISYKITCDDTYTILDLLEKLVPAVAQQPSVLCEIEEIVRDNPNARKNTSKKKM